MLNIPHRIAIAMQDQQNWILRNTIIWDKVKGTMSSSKDNLANEYEFIFHFVKSKTGYYYNTDVIRKKPGKAIIKNGKIELSTELSTQQKENAYKALDNVLERIKKGNYLIFAW